MTRDAPHPSPPDDDLSALPARLRAIAECPAGEIPRELLPRVTAGQAADLLERVAAERNRARDLHRWAEGGFKEVKAERDRTLTAADNLATRCRELLTERDRYAAVLDRVRGLADAPDGVPVGELRAALAAPASPQPEPPSIDLADEVRQLAERNEALNALADCVIEATEYGSQDNGFVASYITPTGPIHRAIPLLEQHGITVRPGFDGRPCPLTCPRRPDAETACGTCPDRPGSSAPLGGGEVQT